MWTQQIFYLVNPRSAEVGHDREMMQGHMTLEYSLEWFWGVAFLVTGVQQTMTMVEQILVFHVVLTYVVTGNVFFQSVLQK